MTAVAAAACAVERLRLYQFRNYAEAVVEFAPGVNVISGSNAQGKTNLLEAVATLSLTRSPRAAATADLLQWGADQCAVEATITRPGAPATLAVHFVRDLASGRIGRSAMVDGKPRPASALPGICPVVLFWPEDLLIVKAGPEARRRLLDTMLAQLDRVAADAMARYRRVLVQRNALLKQLRAGGSGRDMLPGFTREIAALGARIQTARTRLVGALGPHAERALAQLSAGRERLELRYTPAHAPATTDEQIAEEALRMAFAARSGEELARAMTLVGPHRDDLAFDVDGRPARTAASQGQQRSIVLAVKMAEVNVVCDRSGLTPVMILDDVLSELDSSRRTDLLTMLAARAPQQVLLTTAEPLYDLGALHVARRLTVQAGVVSLA